MNSSCLLLWFEAPLQSWGADSKFGRRDTLPFPTKSGVLGLICSALGAGGEQKELLARFAPLNMTVISYDKTQLLGVGREGKPFLRDFQMVGSGYDDGDSWQNLLIPKTSAGKKAVGGGSKMTYRYYLQDAVFAVVLQVPEVYSQALVAALQQPTWTIYLGRKNCVPTESVYQGAFSSEEEAFRAAEAFSRSKNLSEDYRVLQGEHPGHEQITLNDIPVQFGTNKRYRDRRVTVIYTEAKKYDAEQ